MLQEKAGLDLVALKCIFVRFTCNVKSKSIANMRAFVIAFKDRQVSQFDSHTCTAKKDIFLWN